MHDDSNFGIFNLVVLFGLVIMLCTSYSNRLECNKLYQRTLHSSIRLLRSIPFSSRDIMGGTAMEMFKSDAEGDYLT